MSDPTNSIGDAIRNAAEAPKKEKKKKEKKSPPANAPIDDEMPYDISFPDDCPVEPLGVNGDSVFFLDQMRQLRVIPADKLNKGSIQALFGALQDLKYTYWPRLTWNEFKKCMIVTGWRPEQAADCLLVEANRRGIWDVFERVRGPGCWKDSDGKLIMHCGNIVYHGKDALTPAAIGRHVYPAHTPRPTPGTGLDGLAAAEELLAMFKTWNWRRPDLDPYLLLGWICAAMLGGALKWRPLLWITGDKATGKSTLHDVMKGVFGEGGLISTTDATAAGLWQTVGHASLPVALDELEAEADNRKQMNIIKLARQACSGGQTLRGSSDHKNASFTVRSCFLFSSILIPPLPAQDISRMAILQLDKLTGGKQPNIDAKTLERIGDALRERLIERWRKFPSVLHSWQTLLAERGHDGRSADQFGTLMACYELLISDAPFEPETHEVFGQLLDKQGLSETEDSAPDHERCMQHLLTSQLDLYRGGERRTIGSWVMQAAGRDAKNKHEQDMDDANRALGNIGLMVRHKHGVMHLMVANDHQGLAAVFKDTHWTGSSGTNGVWMQAMRRAKNAKADEQRFNGLKKRCTAIPLDVIFDTDYGASEAAS
ncbi:MAG: hypothetical protein DI551_00690 [Micavibrio aeruginosavorus]|uniref:DUF927 domain-containing protein n=1 Tax=Micavibrio aeruginosavorus TaxID=349221 RepID=A0A2W5QBU1_9BACT|nr:MAG: hypothetical protein DI551_00690 [Micavibrio aeruginosavorus]